MIGAKIRGFAQFIRRRTIGKEARSYSDYWEHLQKILFSEDLCAATEWLTSTWETTHPEPLDNVVRSSPTSNLSISELRVVAHYSQFALPFVAFWKIRQEYKKRLIEAVTVSPHMRAERIAFLLEDKQLEEIEKLERYRFLQFVNPGVRKILSYARTCQKVIAGTQSSTFAAKRKKITIVGPQVDNLLGILESKDNPIAGPTLLDHASTPHNHRVFSYINDYNVDFKFPQVAAAMNSGVNIVVKSHRSRLRLIKALKCSLPVPRVGVIRNMDDLLPFNCYGPMQLQGILYDLLSRGFTQIEITGFDLYASALESYNPRYLSIPASGELGVSLVVHDAVSNFLFVKNLREIGVVVPDKTLSEVLSLSTPEYLARLDKKFPWRPGSRRSD